MPIRGVQQHKNTIDIGLNEAAGFQQTPVVMGFGGEVDQKVDLFRAQNAVHHGLILDLAGVEAEPVAIGRIGVDVYQGGQVARISEGIQDHDPIIRMGREEIPAVVAADKSGPAGHQYGLWHSIAP